ncbi:MAG: hypothetical protein HYT75_02660 [Deltaproteobacteria bacterium]|nr:hypothetical protein [Deltaproteobacteria bacterium]
MITARLIILFIIGLAVSGTVFAAVSDDQSLLGAIRNLRLKQENEENVIRVRQFINQIDSSKCTPAESARERIRTLEASDGSVSTEDVNITAGHGELNVTDNHGTINSDINVQIVKDGENRKCL